MICPRCSVAEISSASGACELCGYVPEGTVAVDIPQPDATDQLAREQLAHEFRLDVLLGHGEHSAVFLAREGTSDEYVVLKVLPRSRDRDPQADERFRRAAELVATLDHPHIVAVNRFGASDSLFWYTMDHIRARSLREILRSRGPLDLKTCQRLVAQIASALDYAHRRGVVHGAVKPENVLIDPNGWVHVSDAMVTRALERPPTPQLMRPSAMGPRPSQVAAQPARPGNSERPAPPARRTAGGTERNSPSSGTTQQKQPSESPKPTEQRRPDYSAPEEVQTGFRTPFADQYALAVLVHECLTGTMPSAGAGPFDPPTTLATLRPDMPAHVTHAVQRALSPRQAERFPSILDFAMALETGTLALTDSRPTGVRNSEVILTVPDWKPAGPRVPRWVWFAVGIVLLAVTGLFVFPAYQRWQLARNQWEARPAGTAPTGTPATADSGSLRATADSIARASATMTLPDVSSRTPTRRTRSSSSTTSADTPARSTSRRSRDQSAAPPPAAAPPAATGEQGRLFVNATPWGQVLIDGQPAGNTPRANLAVSPGSHTVRVVREGFEPYERTVTVGAGETIRLTDIVLNARP